MEKFYFCINQHQKNILKHKRIHSDIVGLDDLKLALRRGVNKIIIFNDTIPGIYRATKKYDVDIELWQEGIIPFTSIPFNLKSRLRIAVNKFVPRSIFKGYRPYFFNGIQTIRAAYPASMLEKKGVTCKKIIYDPEIFSYRPEMNNASGAPLYLATDFYSEGLLQDHAAQLKNFENLKKTVPNIKFKPHPKEIDLSLEILGQNNIEMDTIYSHDVYGTISTSIFLNHTGGSRVNFVLDGHSEIVKRAFKENVEILYR